MTKMDIKIEFIEDLTPNDQVMITIKQEIKDCKDFQINHELLINQKEEGNYKDHSIKKEINLSPIHFEEIVDKNQLSDINTDDVKHEPLEKMGQSKKIYEYHVIKEEMVLGQDTIQEISEKPQLNDIRIFENDIPATKQQREEIYKCNRCCMEFPIKSCFEKHMCLCICTNLLKCDNCNKISNSKTTSVNSKNLKKHKKLKQMNYDETCKKCDRKFRLKKSLMQHMKSHNSFNNDTMICNVCGKDFTTAQSLARHITIIHAKIKPFSCNECSKTYTHKRDFEYHIQKIHSFIRTATGPITMTMSCEFCKKVFADKSSCTRHKNYTCPMNKNKKEKTKKMQLKHLCNICQKSYNHKHSLTKHMKIHLGTLVSYQCDICTKEYRKKDNLRSHIQSKHMNLRLICDICKKAFSCRWSLSCHKRTQHKAISNP